MGKTRRASQLLLAGGVALALTAPAGAAAAPQAPTCTQGQVSAIDQYCETIPAPTGARAPRVGEPSLAATLPPAQVRRLASGPDRQLLTLPASTARRARRSGSGASSGGAVETPAGVSTAAASVWSLSAPLVAILVALALGLAGVAAARRRRAAPPAAPQRTPAAK